ncbi:MAG TPA: hypothetical protein VEI97_16570, partial [bacterium]|nr:hypothetical protein [bacterium]
TFVKAEVARYMIGGYGSYTTEGQDIIRLERESSTGDQLYWRLPPPWSPGDNVMALNYNVQNTSQGGLPEMCGGGSDVEGPWYPYDASPDFPNAFIYGSPDGIPDAVVIVLTAGDEVQAY